MSLTNDSIKSFLEEKTARYNNAAFIDEDPVSIPHAFSIKEDIEIAAFLTATISWGQRKTILKNAGALMVRMDSAPYQFIQAFQAKDLTPFRTFKHRTFNGDDCIFFLRALKHIYSKKGGLESIFISPKISDTQVKAGIINARAMFFLKAHEKRQEKHFSDPARGSAAKRLNMFLRWMVRKDRSGVDFGIWKNISPSSLLCPLDVHSGRVARKLGLLSRKQDDWQAVDELTANLRHFDPKDPVKFDFALFGLGVFEKF
jgi:uncharacterized protein (TIGR02757 family)